ncbi:MAG: hypothetical protein HQL07_07385 [Nitrospirae bacterium]|nr:hypothetical protein [Magnetococcales bacterium]HAT49546.1 hypothetical protein [Alphaproteobacteria bacterium]
MINVSMLEITLSRSTMTFGNGDEGGFQSIYNETIQATSTRLSSTSGEKLEEATQASSGMEGLLALLQQRNPVPCCLQQDPSQEITGATGKNKQKNQDGDEAGFQDLLAKLFEMLDQTSELVAELYKLAPDDTTASSSPILGEPETALPLAA